MTDDPKKKGAETSAGWVQTVAAARVVSAEELRRQAAMFRPTPKQALFRDFAERQVEMGNLLLSRWLLATKDPSFTNTCRRPVSRREWDNWLTEPGFSDWFFEPIPQVAPLAEQEKQLADQIFLEGLMRGMQGEKEWAFKEYGRFRFAQVAKGAAATSQPAAATPEVQSFLAPDESVSAWSKSTKAEA
jgi:hypothetical protein